MRSLDREIAARLRQAKPQVEATPPPFATVATLIQRSESGPPRAIRGSRRQRFGVLLALGALTLAGSGWGASQLLSGAPVSPTFAWVKAKPTVALGVPLPSSLKVLGLRAADPAGGPPWGMRIIRTSRGQACIQAGRVVDGRVGALGTGYAFHADGRFHPFAPGVGVGLECSQVDAGGNLYHARGAITASADGLSLAENTFERVHCDLPDQHNWGVRCPTSQLRLLAFGALGPDATRLSVSFQGRSFDVRPYGPEGAYLLAFPAPKGTNVGPYFGAQAPHRPTLTVHFRDGSSCLVPEANDTDECKPEGIDFSNGPKLTAAELATPVHVSYTKRLAGGEPPLTTDGQHSVVVDPTTKPGPVLIVTFRARVGTPAPLSAYAAEIHRPVIAGCFGGSRLLSQEPTHTIASGQRVRIVIPLQATCHGRYAGRVLYFAIDRSLQPGSEERLLGGISRRMLGLPHNRGRDEQELTVGRFAIDLPVDHR
ncbi:MAG TPA: hypothetical protein VK781_10785 [Solirubrobacteraceae bacterium]|jgi:hypothetical protein|nr:hypothetical protein [Solirubrobacteraceae bacterium]